MVYPTDEKTRVRGSFSEVENLKFPLSSVNVPVEVPFTVTETAEIASFVLTFFTLPETVVDCCAIVDTQIVAPTINNPQWVNNRLILASFLIKLLIKIALVSIL